MLAGPPWTDQPWWLGHFLLDSVHRGRMHHADHSTHTFRITPARFRPCRLTHPSRRASRGPRAASWRARGPGADLRGLQPRPAMDGHGRRRYYRDGDDLQSPLPPGPDTG